MPEESDVGAKRKRARDGPVMTGPSRTRLIVSLGLLGSCVFFAGVTVGILLGTRRAPSGVEDITVEDLGDVWSAPLPPLLKRDEPMDSAQSVMVLLAAEPSEAQLRELEAIGLEVHSVMGRTLTGRLDSSRLPQIRAVPFVSKVQKAGSLQLLDAVD